ncbi:hypothetical protein EDE04_6484 [Streptomyces sp. 2132.2]|uniref:hypothetical protein n=1 Tax=Streptomyces sp. 2132.2 TaxID=2485161 RepID=UPI000FA40914|nr:hypothetical protein [Streptomyces sp. 2132.2]ROQ99926.1 hypothetical protein EDE04_6484 [Streptomyces sp. 2132.2]
MPSSRPGGPGYVRVGFTVLPRWLLWLVAALVVAGGVSTGVLLAVAPAPGERAADLVVSGLPSPAGADPAPPSAAAPPSTRPSPTQPSSTQPSSNPPTSGSAPATVPSAAATPPVRLPVEPDPDPPEDPGDVVEEYYRYLANRDFAAAWELGGKYIAHTSYAKWVAGYDTTAALSLDSAATLDAGRVRVAIRALQTDGTLRAYEGTYTVSGGVITDARVTGG